MKKVIVTTQQIDFVCAECGEEFSIIRHGKGVDGTRTDHYDERPVFCPLCGAAEGKSKEGG